MEDITFENWEQLPSLADADAAELAEAIRYVLDAKRGKDIAVIPVEGRSDITDCFVLSSANSGTHVRALADEVEYKLKLAGADVRLEGNDSNEWKVIDCKDVIVHIFSTEAREFYKLDRLWADCEEVDINKILNS